MGLGGWEEGRSIKCLRRIIGALHPAPAELAARLEGGWKLRAGVCAGAAVLLTPNVGGGAPFLGAAVELTKAAAGDLIRTFSCQVLLQQRIREKRRLTARSNCVPLTSFPVLVACTIIVFPLIAVLVNVSL